LGTGRPENRQEAEISLAFFLQILLIGPAGPVGRVPGWEPSKATKAKKMQIRVVSVSNSALYG
jgi:hypothetical protein